MYNVVVYGAHFTILTAYHEDVWEKPLHHTGGEQGCLPDRSLANASRGPVTKHTTGEGLTNQFTTAQ